MVDNDDHGGTCTPVTPTTGTGDTTKHYHGWRFYRDKNRGYRMMGTAKKRRFESQTNGGKYMEKEENEIAAREGRKPDKRRYKVLECAFPGEWGCPAKEERDTEQLRGL